MQHLFLLWAVCSLSYGMEWQQGCGVLIFCGTLWLRLRGQKFRTPTPSQNLDSGDSYSDSAPLKQYKNVGVFMHILSTKYVAWATNMCKKCVHKVHKDWIYCCWKHHKDVDIFLHIFCTKCATISTTMCRKMFTYGPQSVDIKSTNMCILFVHKMCYNIHKNV